MNQQEKLEAQFRAKANLDDLPQHDPFPRMILVCVGISVTLFVIIAACIFVDFVVMRPEQNVRSAPMVPAPAAIAPDDVEE